MHVHEPHIKIARTHNSLGYVTGSIPVGGTFAGWCRSTNVCIINSSYTTLLTEHTYQLTGHKVTRV